MAITPVGFNVPALSPAALLSNRDDGGFQEALDQAISFGFNSRLQQQAQEAAEARQVLAGEQALDRQITSDVARGFLVDPTTVDPASITLPGESVPQTLQTVEGRVTSASISAAQSRVARAQPFRDPSGRPVIPGTTVGTVTDPNSGQVSNVLREQVTLADVEEIQALRDTIDVAANPGIVRALDATLATARADSAFTISEFEAIKEEFFTGPRFTAYDQATRAVRALGVEERKMFETAQFDVNQRNEVLMGDGSRRNLAPDERTAMALAFTGATLPPESQEIMEAINGGEVNLVPRQAPRNMAELTRFFNAAGTQAQQENLSFQRWLIGNLMTLDGREVAPEGEAAAEMIRADGGEVSVEGLRNFSTSGSALGAHFRQAFTLTFDGVLTRSGLHRQQDRSIQYPFSTDGADRVMEAIDPGYADVAPRADGANRGTNVAPATAAEEENNRQRVESTFETQRSEFQNSFVGADPTSLQSFRNSLMGDDPETITRDALNTATNFDQAGDTAAAAAWRALADMAQNDTGAFFLLRDSVLIPSLPR